MIGIIDNRFIFEFRDHDELVQSLSVFASRNGFETLAITNSKLEPFAILKNDYWVKVPNAITDDREYIIYMNDKGIYEPSLLKTEKLGNEEQHKFTYRPIRVPTIIS